ncbi:MAG TPA: 50S ribosomal protein L21 [Candidatus Saccharimonadales bacterium]|jgi:large subunit ribosomal protein L21|nr:50S ribosomal protein L21 [Candidatus Saccharimonadales bacterium]
MKKAVIASGGKQYIVFEGQSLEVELLKAKGKSVDFDALLLIDDIKVNIGQPLVAGVKVTADIIDPEIKADKVVAIRYKAKKRVRKIQGHRQKLTSIKIKKIV